MRKCTVKAKKQRATGSASAFYESNDTRHGQSQGTRSRNQTFTEPTQTSGQIPARSASEWIFPFSSRLRCHFSIGHDATPLIVMEQGGVRSTGGFIRDWRRVPLAELRAGCCDAAVRHTRGTSTGPVDDFRTVVIRVEQVVRSTPAANNDVTERRPEGCHRSRISRGERPPA